jgi:hypothetical protein
MRWDTRIAPRTRSKNPSAKIAHPARADSPFTNSLRQADFPLLIRPTSANPVSG